MEIVEYQGRCWEIVRTEEQAPVAYLDGRGKTVRRDPAMTVLYLREAVPFTWDGFEDGEFAARVDRDEVGEFLALCDRRGIERCFYESDPERLDDVAFECRDGRLRYGPPRLFRSEGARIAGWCR